MNINHHVPCDRFAERWLAGSLLIGASADQASIAADLIGELKPQHVFHEQEREIVRIGLKLKTRGERVSAVAIIGELETENRFTPTWPSAKAAAQYFAELMEEVPMPWQVSEWSARVRASHAQRQAFVESQALLQELCQPSINRADTAERAARIAELIRRSDPKASQPRFVMLRDAAAGYLDRVESGRELLISTGISELDRAIGGGMAYGEMVLVCGRPGQGKSTVGRQIFDHALGQSIPAAYLSEEMSATALGKRTVQYASTIHEDHWVNRMTGVRQDVDIHFHDRAPGLIFENCRTAATACDIIRQAVREHGVRLVVIDYAQLLGSPGKSRYEQVTNTSIALRQVTNETGIILVALCQLNREIEERSPMIPRPSDIRDSGQLEQDADVIVLLVWPHRFDSQNDPGVYQFFIGKNRNRPIVSAAVECRFDPSRQRITAAPADQREQSHVPDYDKGWR